MSKGSSSVGMISTEEQNATRRSQKAKQKRKRSSGVNAGTDILTLIRQDRQEERQRRQDAAQRRKDAAERSMCKRIEQASKAADQPSYKALVRETVAEKVASGILLHFATVTPAKDQSRLYAAFQKAKEALSADELQRTRALDKGYSAAKQALNAAYKLVGDSPVPQPRSSSE